jgi:hypothetical protein
LLGAAEISRPASPSACDSQRFGPFGILGHCVILSPRNRFTAYLPQVESALAAEMFDGTEKYRLFAAVRIDSPAIYGDIARGNEMGCLLLQT